MPSGSTDPDDLDTESQCVHCGRWYSRRGVLNHEDNCPFRDVGHRVVDLIDPWAIRRADDVSIDDVEATDAPDTTPEPAETPSADPNDAHEPQGSDVETTSTALTDGGPRSLPDFDPDVDVDRELEDDQEASGGDPTCPSCGSTHVEPVSDLPDALLDAAPALAAQEWLCVPCSTDGDVGGTVDQADLLVEDVDGQPSIRVEAFRGGAA